MRVCGGVLTLVGAWFMLSTEAEDIKCFPTDAVGNLATDYKGNQYDLTALKKNSNQEAWKVTILTPTNETAYYINVCDRIGSDKKAEEVNAAVWRVAKDNNEKKKYTKGGDILTAKITIIQNEVLQMEYTGGDLCPITNEKMSSLIFLICKPDKPIDNPPSLIRDDGCTYYFEWLTPAACPIEKSYKTMSITNLFIIIMIPAVLLYLVGGFLYRRLVLRKRGRDQIPQADFWMDLGVRARASITETIYWFRSKFSKKMIISVQADPITTREEHTEDNQDVIIDDEGTAAPTPPLSGLGISVVTGAEEAEEIGQHFRFCGGLDCPDWLLAEISLFQKLSLSHMTDICATVADDISGTFYNDDWIVKFTEDVKFSVSDMKAVIAALAFILTSTTKYDVTSDELIHELHQLGLPNEYVEEIGKIYKKKYQAMKAFLSSQTLRLPSVLETTHKVKYVLASNELQRVNEPIVQLRLLIGEKGNSKPMLCEMTTEKFKILLY
eukprot:Ihof_evm5s33 gene=Ihof_evmTU5s33